ncbi:MAG: T9SS type A sorting domain-containing protein [Bacteroidetes bacterium]|nr:T9SS type A sorting domain-containing protein [Bacteroidota bacterium]
MSSNGVWIANANNDTMLNGAGLNPGSNVNSWPNGLLNTYANIFLPYPNDTNKYILFHHTDTVSGNTYMTRELFYSLIDMTLANGLGGVIKKNQIAFQDTLSWGIAACRHANGRDWWIVAKKDNDDKIITVLFTDSGISNISYQSLNYSPYHLENINQLTFSRDGKQIMLSTYDNPISKKCSLVISNFNRCTGMFSNTQVVLLSKNLYLWGLAFSASGNYAYACSSQNIFQVSTTTLQVDTVAWYDGFSFPLQSAATTFFNMYLAANGKIYITSGNGVQHLHEMNYPDSAGLGCDVQQHSIFLNIWNFRAVPNHPNYYLGCDTTLGCGCATSYNQYAMDDSKFNIYPNPNNGVFSIGYKAIATTSKLSVIDVNGKTIYTQTLPPWSNEQSIKCLLTKGVYVVRIENGSEYVSRKMLVIDN